VNIPDAFDLAGVASPGDIVILRVIKEGLSVGAKLNLACELRRAAEFWGVRFVLLDAKYIDLERFTGPEGPE